jgi:hypothetical protein
MGTETSSAEAGADIPRGGVWEKQALFGGKRLGNEFASGEAFILWGMAITGDVPMQTGELATKTELEVSRIIAPDDRFKVNTLSKPIAAMVAEAGPGDFPVEAFWHEVETSMQPAVVLTAVRRWIEP